MSKKKDKILQTFNKERFHVQPSQRERNEVIDFWREVHFMLKTFQMNAQNLQDREKRQNIIAFNLLLISMVLAFRVVINTNKFLFKRKLLSS